MGKKRIIGMISALFLCILIVACSGDDSKTEEEEVNVASGEEARDETDEVEEEDPEPSDEELIESLEKNLQTLMDKDIDAHMETVHKDSPLYNSTRDLVEKMMAFDFESELFDLKVEEKSDKEAKVSYRQTTIGLSEGMTNSEVTGVHTLRPEGGVWKIYDSEVYETALLDDNGEPIDMEAEGSVLATIQGDYAEDLKELELSFGGAEVQLNDYYEEEDYAAAEILLQDEQYSEVYITIEYNKNVKELLNASEWVANMESLISENVDGDLKFEGFDLSEEEAFYELSLADDSTNIDQTELTRGFFKGEDLVAVSFLVMNQTEIDDETKNEWIENLKKIK